MVFISTAFNFFSVTTEFPSTLLTAEGIKSAHTSLTVEDLAISGEWDNIARSEVGHSEK